MRLSRGEFVDRLDSMIGAFCLVSTLVLCTSRLLGLNTWSWLWLTAPLWLPLLIMLIMFVTLLMLARLLPAIRRGWVCVGDIAAVSAILLLQAVSAIYRRLHH